ncbi:hypothetical protein IKF94_01460 [Candidatus Saccharibacteria bacterium]|nr:hypothetical protein [Candidatus Saccharibacteria bacterium]
MEILDSHEANIYGQLLSLTSPSADVIRQKWHERLININRLNISSRSINYYESIDLIQDPRNDVGRGWRRFTYIEAVYLLIVRELRRYGIDTSFIKTFYDSFLKKDDSLFTDAILLVHLGYTITITIEPNGTEHILSARELAERSDGSEPPASEIRLNLASFVYWADCLLGGHVPLQLDPYLWLDDKARNDKDLGALREDWCEQEKMLVDRFRQTASGESFMVKRTLKGETYTEYNRPIKIDRKLEESLADIAGDYGEVIIKMSGRRAVRGSVKKTTKL